MDGGGNSLPLSCSEIRGQGRSYTRKLPTLSRQPLVSAPDLATAELSCNWTVVIAMERWYDVLGPRSIFDRCPIVGVVTRDSNWRGGETQSLAGRSDDWRRITAAQPTCCPPLNTSPLGTILHNCQTYCRTGNVKSIAIDIISNSPSIAVYPAYKNTVPSFSSKDSRLRDSSLQVSGCTTATRSNI